MIRDKMGIQCGFREGLSFGMAAKKLSAVLCNSDINEDTVGDYLDPAAWKCSVFGRHIWDCHFPLAGTGTVLGLEEQKLKEGKDLIRYFCVPCKPTKVNGGRTRNLPEHDMKK